jgi:hypothetical protein
MVKRPKTTNGTQPSDAAPKYDIGYRRPPAHTRFKPGHRGCGGRPKKQRNLRTVLEETLDERITIREGKRTRSVTKRDAMRGWSTTPFQEMPKRNQTSLH